jgi:hypothetical protein
MTSVMNSTKITEDDLFDLDGTSYGADENPLDGYTSKVTFVGGVCDGSDIDRAFDSLSLAHVPSVKSTTKVTVRDQAKIDAQKAKENKNALAKKEREEATKKAQQTVAKNTQVKKLAPVRMCDECRQPVKKCVCDEY